MRYLVARASGVLATTALVVLSIASTETVFAQFDPEPAMNAQREAMNRLSYMDGVWRGPAWMLTSTGREEFTQTERVGTMLDGTIRVVEGRGYDEEGVAAFNAFAVVSFDQAAGTYTMRSYARGQLGDFELKQTDNGVTWEIPAGPATIRYVATFSNGTWHEYGERVVEGQDPFRFVEFTLQRIDDTTWPAGGAVQPR